jgi:hypothetical protein
MDRTAERGKGGSTVNIVLYSIVQVAASVPDTSEIPLKSFMDIVTNLVSNQEVIEGTILRVCV